MSIYQIAEATVTLEYGRVRQALPVRRGLLETIPVESGHAAARAARRHAKSGQAVLLTGPGEFRPRLYRPGARARSSGWAYEIQCGCGHWQIPDAHGQPVPLCATCVTESQRDARAAAQEVAIHVALDAGTAPAEILVPLGFAAGLLGMRPESLRTRVKSGHYPGAVRTERADGKGLEWRIPLSEIPLETGCPTPRDPRSFTALPAPPDPDRLCP